MMKSLGFLVTALALAVPLPMAAQTAAGTDAATRIIIKINTPEGPKWFRLGDEVEQVDVTDGKVVEFNYQGDSIEATTVLPDDTGDATKKE